jgi:cytoskeletal protein CcmA (bactofilin family)
MSSVNSIFGPDVTITGEVTGEAVRIDGVINGDVRVTRLVLGGLVTGNITATQADISGRVNGNIVAETVNLFVGAVISGDITCKNLSAQPGAVFNSKVSFTDDLNSVQDRKEPKDKRTKETSSQ